MKKALIGVAALASMLPHATLAATDGQPGATSTGSFDVTLTVSPPGGSTVQVLGLDDVDLTGGIITHETVSTGTGPLFEHFCILRSDAGEALVTVTQTNLPSGISYALQGTSDANGDGVTDSLSATMLIRNPNAGDTVGLQSGDTVTVQQSGTGCTAASDNSLAHELEFQLNGLPPASVHRLAGAYTGAFTITVSLP